MNEQQKARIVELARLAEESRSLVLDRAPIRHPENHRNYASRANNTMRCGFVGAYADPLAVERVASAEAFRLAQGA